MSFEDARKILSGNDTAATDYFKSKTTEQLTVAFRPHVERTMKENGVTKQYEALTAQLKSIPFAKSEDLDINGTWCCARRSTAFSTCWLRKSRKFARIPPPAPPICSNKSSAGPINNLDLQQEVHPQKQRRDTRGSKRSPATNRLLIAPSATLW